MLRIKDSIDLAELEKFGFKEDRTGILNVWGKEYKVTHVTEDTYPTMIFITDKRELILYNDEEEMWQQLLDESLLETVYDLAEAGVLERKEGNFIFGGK